MDVKKSEWERQRQQGIERVARESRPAEMLKGGVIMDVTNAEQAKIARKRRPRAR